MAVKSKNPVTLTAETADQWLAEEMRIIGDKVELFRGPVGFMTIESLQLKAERKAREAKGVNEKAIKAVVILGISDSGPCDNGVPSACCPHCGAFGRYIVRFRCEDGVIRSCMKGCFNLWRKNHICTEQMRLEEKQERYAREKWELPSWDKNILLAIDQFKDGEITEQEAERVISTNNQAAQAYRQRNGKRC